MAPSPTGALHIGTARTTLFNWLFARHSAGTFILRIEDTDQERSKPEHEIGLIQGLKWLGLEWDEGPDLNDRGELVSRGDHGPYRQSERTSIYRKHLEQLLAEGKAYYCYCTKEELEAQRQSLESAGLAPKYTGTCRNLSAPPEGRSANLIRFKMPEEKVSFPDLIRGKTEFDAALFGDIVIAKDLDQPLYNFAVVIDDELMRISHVIRGEDHIPNTPKQILLQRAFGFRTPAYAHIPLILNPDRSKLSKRSNKTSLLEYRDDGYLPEAMVNFLALLGWHPKVDREVLSTDELVKEFELGRVQKAGAVFDLQKLDWLNGQYLRALPPDELARRVAPFAPAGVSPEKIGQLAELVKDRMRTLKDFTELARPFVELPAYEAELLLPKDGSKEGTQATIQAVRDALAGTDEANLGDRAVVLDRLAPLIERSGRGGVLWPFRVALSGLRASPDPIAIAGVLGKAETLRRLEVALTKLS